MPFYPVTRPIILMMLSLTLFPPTCMSQSTDTSSDWSDAVVRWDNQCGAKGCLLMTDVLRGESGRPPDPKDSREYIGIYVAVDRATRKPSYFAFHVDPNAQQDQGVFVAFTKTTKEGDKWKMNLDGDGATRLPFSSCSKDSCVARVLDGVVAKTDESSGMNLLDKFLNSDTALFLYVKNGHPYRTMVPLASFKKEYQKMLSSELAPVPSQQR
jgi:hypothetical protein